MTENKGLFVLLNEIVQKYIKDYFDVKSGTFEENSPNDIFLGTNEVINEVLPKDIKRPIYAIDGSSRSLTSASGIISISTLAVSSSYLSIYGVFPSLFDLPSLPISKPFIGLASSNPSRGKIEPFLYSSNSLLTSISLNGEPFLSTHDPERIETEIRGVLETEALKITKDKGLTIIDGPLFPSYIYLPDKVKIILTKERSKIIDQNYIGIVKRLDKSNLLVKVLSENSKEFENKYKINPQNFLSDESFLYQLVRFNYAPPYPILSVGPLVREIEKLRYYIFYLVLPYHKYVPKFSILRIESISRDAINIASSLPFSSDGIPKILAIADKTAKELSSGILKYIIFSLNRIGLQESFRDKFEVYNLV